MRVVLDTNILVSAVLSPSGNAGAAWRAWRERRYVLLTCQEQLDELRMVFNKPAIAAMIKPYLAGTLVNQIKAEAEMVPALARVQRSPDPNDDFLLALAQTGSADYLVSGDKAGLLSLKRHGSTKILSLGAFVHLLS